MKQLTQFSSTKEISEIKISYSRKVYFSRKQITSSLTCANILRELYDPETLELFECFYVLFMNPFKNVIGFYKLGQGGYDSVVVERRLIFALALQTGCTEFIISHNHPTGNLMPSNADLAITNSIKQGAEILGLKLLDHIIITANAYLSFGDEGLI